MNIQQAIQALAKRGDETYCKICTVDAVDEAARTVDVSPLDESAPILGVNLQANQSAEMGVVYFPKVGSHVVVSFLNPAAAVVVLTDEIEKIILKLGAENPVELEAVDGSVKLKIGTTSAEIIKDKKITFNGGENGGLVIIQKLTDKINALVDAFNNHTHTLATGAVGVEGSATKQANIAPITVPAISSKATKLSKSDYEDTNIKH